MCDQTEVAYLDGDVVWVKFGSIWWPGIVKDLEKDDEGKEILAGLKSKPIAVVQFFDEENLEFVKNLDQIYHYVCRRKDEFIKKGLDKFRSGASHMKKFPDDVVKAESLTNGDLDIINDPKFAPEAKLNYSDIFGSSKQKKKDGKEGKGRGRKSEQNTPIRAITHHRFLQKAIHGTTDHVVTTRIQKNVYRNSTEKQEEKTYACHVCNFTTSRVGTITAHHRLLHGGRAVEWGHEGFTPKQRRSTAPRRKPKQKQRMFELVEGEQSSDDEPLSQTTKHVSKPKPPTAPKRSRPVKDQEQTDKKPKFTDDLLADWLEDDDDEEKTKPKEADKPTENESQEKEKEEEVENEAAQEEEEETEVTEKKDETVKTSCFDFDDEEEGFIGMSNANTYGRKIPRVIPPKDKSDLGLDLEVEELFKRKSESSENNNDETPEPAPPKKRGRKKKIKTIEKPEDKEEKEEKKPAVSTLASTRVRRPGSRKSYLNEVIEKIEDDETSGDERRKSLDTKPPKPEGSSRRKQDLKSSSFESSREEIVYSEIIEGEEKEEKKRRGRKRKVTEVEKQNEKEDDLSLQIDDLLAETKVPSFPSPTKAKTSELTTESTEDTESAGETKQDIKISSPSKPTMTASKLAHKFRLIQSPGGLNKTTCLVLPGGKRIDVMVKGGSKDPTEVRGLLKRTPEKLTPAILSTGKLKGQTIVQQKDGKYMILTQSPLARHKVVSSTKTSPGRNVVVINSKHGDQLVTSDSSEGPSTSGYVPQTAKIVKVLPEGRSGIANKVSVSFPSTKVILPQSTGKTLHKIEAGLGKDFTVVKNYKGTGKTVFIKRTTSGGGSSNSLLLRPGPARTGLTQVFTTVEQKVKPKIVMRTEGEQGEYVVTQAITASADTPTYVMKRQGPDGKFTARKVTKVGGGAVQLLRTSETGQKTIILSGQQSSHKPAAVKIHQNKLIRITPKVAAAETIVKPVHHVVQLPAVTEQPSVTVEQQPQPMLQNQIVAMPGIIGADGNQTYMLVTVDENGVFQAVNNSVAMSYEDTTQQPDQTVYNSNNMIVINQPATEELPVYNTASQDILAEALANTNVLDMEQMVPTMLMPATIPQSVVQETSVTLQKPIMTPLELPSAVAPDTSGLEPPPLPPTPTEEDVLMDEQPELEEHQTEMVVEESAQMEETIHEDVNVSQDNAFYNNKAEEAENQPPGDFVIEDSQEDQGTNSFQSMPLLNDEPDTSNDGVDSEPIESQDFEVQRSQFEPSSTNADFGPTETFTEYVVQPGTEQEDTRKEEEEQAEDAVQEQVLSYELDPHLADALSQKRSQETEVTSTTDEFSKEEIAK